MDKLEMFKIFLTASLTIIGGIVIFITGQITLKFIIEPILELKRTEGEIAYFLTFYANVYMNPLAPYEVSNKYTNKCSDVQETFRSLASQICLKANVIPWYMAWEFLKVVPKFNNLMEVARELIGLSNSVHNVNVEMNRTRCRKIQQLLSLRILVK